jgi:tetracycline 7-halogenase / FADH2 O2-dependent halogenase
MRWKQVTDRLYDIAVVGSGFAGSLLAMIAQRLGRSVILIEKGRHPRFAIGESSTPITNLLIEDLTTRYNLPALTPLAKWGTWQQAYPDLAGGLKRGFTFYHHTLGKPAEADPNRANQLLVAASPHDRIADTHWFRAEFDQFFVNEAQKIGVEYLDETNLRAFSESEDEVRLDGSRHGEDLTVRAKYLVDATGPRGFLHHALRLPELPIPDMPPTQALYSHFSHVGRLGDINPALGEQPPYPVDDAAVHHVFDGGWIWVLQFNNGVTSAGVAATADAAQRLQLGDGADAWYRLLSLIPNLQQQFAAAKTLRPFVHVPRLSFRSGAVAGDRWVLLPSAAGFVDPLLSTGFALTLLGVARLVEIIEKHWESESFSTRVQAAAWKSDAELLATGRLIGSLYASMENFPVFVSLSLLYFAAVIFSETARRLGRPELAGSFLLHDRPVFGAHCLELFARVRQTGDPQESAQLCEEIVRAIEPLNLAGLGNPHRRNWYPVEAQDLFESAWKVGATREQITQLLNRCGFRPQSDA